MITYALITSPLGPFLIGGTDAGITHMSFQHAVDPFQIPASWVRDDLAFPNAQEQLQAYFSGQRTTFDLPLTPHGTAFQKQVWQALLAIPYGQTTSYGAIAKQLGKPNASRAVGAANGQNPIPVVIPCHRVIGANGKLTGYAGGLAIKEALLTLEGVLPADDGDQLALF